MRAGAPAGRWRTAIRLLLFGIAWGACAAVCGQAPTGDPGSYQERLERARAAADAAAALPHLLEAERLAAHAEPRIRAEIHFELGRTYRNLARYPEALAAYANALTALDQSASDEDDPLRPSILMAQGIVYQKLERYVEAAERFEQAAERTPSRYPENLAMAYGNLGSAYFSQSLYAKAARAYRQALEAAGQLANPPRRLLTMLRTDIGMVHTELGDYPAAMTELETALGMLEGDQDPATKGRTLHHLAYAYLRRGEQEGRPEDLEKSVALSDVTLALRRRAKDTEGEGKSLNNLGYTYAKLGRFEPAFETLQHALSVAREQEDRVNESRTLDSIAFVYLEQRDYARALNYFHEAAAIAYEIGDRGAQHVMLANIGKVFQRQEQPELAIVFLKKSVEVIEQIRGELLPLPATVRRSYAASVADTYRRLADLLLSQNRPLEAERVIDLLRVEELSEYLGGVRGSEAELHYLPGEESVWQTYMELLEQSIDQAKELGALQDIPSAERSPAQVERVREIRAIQADALKAFREFRNSPDIQAALDSKRLASQAEVLEFKELLNLSEQLKPNEVLFYPFVLADRLELIFATANSVPVHIAQPVTEEELNKTVFDFRQALMGRTGGVEALAKKLHGWLLKPLAEAQAQLKLPPGQALDTIVYVPDGMLRYVPLAALHDGEDWVARNYRVYLITARSLSGFGRPPADIDAVLAGAFTSDRADVDVAGSPRTFQGLPYARIEVQDLETLYPGGRILFDSDFKRDNFLPALEDFRLVHMATHGVFVPGRPPEDSFILFGDGGRASLTDIQDGWLLRGVEMVVLSACETGIGGKLGNGEEIHGFGYLMQEAGANSVMASLWQVSDGGTQALMSTFYRNLKQSGISKAEALRQAQLMLIDNRLDAEVATAVRGFRPIDRTMPPPNFAHPFYWASFVLIGNGR